MASLIEPIELIVGESMDVYLIASSDYPVFDVNWVSNLVIRRDKIDGAVLISRTLPKIEADIPNNVVADSSFVFQLTPTETDLLGVGKVYVSIETRNDTVSFNRELVQTKLTIKQSGI